MKTDDCYKIRRAHATVAVAGALALLAGFGARDARAQADVTSQPSPAVPGWYSYDPARGWVRYAAPSAPMVTSSAPSANVVATPPPGWSGYAPANGWVGYAPASSPSYPNSPVRVPRRQMSSSDGSLQRAANQAVNRIAPQYSFAIPAYREYGSGRNIPLAKPWLPPSP